MTQARKLKKAIRSRAAKTGESYTSARRQVLEARRRRAVATPGAPARASARPAAVRARTRASSYAASVRQKTGHGLDHWFGVLDRFDARARGHAASARHLGQEHGVPDWHCQMITVEYERARGLRVTNQTCDGDFQVTVSRTVGATVEQVAALINDARRRRRWLCAADPQIARTLEAAFAADKPRRVTVKTPQYARMRFPCEGSTVELLIYGKPGGKAAVSAHNTKLGGLDAVEARRAVWGAALDGLRKALAG
jgi:hypothetical protein